MYFWARYLWCKVWGKKHQSNSRAANKYSTVSTVTSVQLTIQTTDSYKERHLTTCNNFFYVFLTVYLSIFILVINQLDAQNFVHQVG